jgi:hypothetical protein
MPGAGQSPPGTEEMGEVGRTEWTWRESIDTSAREATDGMGITLLNLRRSRIRRREYGKDSQGETCETTREEMKAQEKRRKENQGKQSREKRPKQENGG